MKEFITGKMDAVFALQLEQMERELKTVRKRNLPSITISREFGCEGYDLAKLLASKLTDFENPWAIFGRDAIKELTSNKELAQSLWQTIPDETRSLFTQYIDASLSNKPTDLIIFKRMAKSIKILTNGGHSIIVGSAGAVISQDNPHTYHFRLVASEEFRLKRSISMGIPENEAKTKMNERDEQRLRFVQEFTGKDIRDPQLYTAVFNNSKMNIDEIADQIVSYISKRTK